MRRRPHLRSFIFRLLALTALLANPVVFAEHGHHPHYGGFWGNPMALGMLPQVGQSLQKTLDNHGNLDDIHQAQQQVDQLGALQNSLDQAAKSGNYDTSDYGAVQQALADATRNALSPQSPNMSSNNSAPQTPAQSGGTSDALNSRSNLMDGTLPATASKDVPNAIANTQDKTSATSGSTDSGYSGRILGSEAGGQIVYVDPSKLGDTSNADLNASANRNVSSTKDAVASPEDLTNQVNRGPTDLAPKPKLSDFLMSLAGAVMPAEEAGQKEVPLQVLGEPEMAPARDRAGAQRVLLSGTAPLSVGLVFDHLKTIAEGLARLARDSKNLYWWMQFMFVLLAATIVLLAAKVVYDRKLEEKRVQLLRFLQKQIHDQKAFLVAEKPTPSQTKATGSQYIYLHREKKQWYMATLDKAGKKLLWNSPLAEGSTVSLERFGGHEKQNVVIGKDGVLIPTLQQERIGVHVKGEDMSKFSNKLHATGK